jgi:carbamoyl-phosphate synthase large subunit
MAKSQPAVKTVVLRNKIKNAEQADGVNILFTCIGRRVSLLNSFRQAARQMKITTSLFGTDNNELSSALQLCDRRFLVKPITHTDYIKQLLSIVKIHGIRLLIPTVDLDL